MAQEKPVPENAQPELSGAAVKAADRRAEQLGLSFSRACERGRAAENARDKRRVFQEKLVRAAYDRAADLRVFFADGILAAEVQRDCQILKKSPVRETRGFVFRKISFRTCLFCF